MISAESIDLIDHSTSYAIVASENNANVVVAPTCEETESALEREDADPKGRRLDKNRMELDGQVLAYGRDEPIVESEVNPPGRSSTARSSTQHTGADDGETSDLQFLGYAKGTPARRSGMNRRGKSQTTDSGHVVFDFPRRFIPLRRVGVPFA